MNKYTDQEFTYRETTVSYDGIAKLDSIKGNTVAWNQLVRNGNFVDTSYWSTSSSVSKSASNNIMNVTNTIGQDGDYYISQTTPMVIGHKYYFHAEAKQLDTTMAQSILLVFYGGASNNYTMRVDRTQNWFTASIIFTCVSNTYNTVRLRAQIANGTNQFKNVFMVDLTQMYGDGNEPTTAEEFTSLYSLPFYSYNSGTLVNFCANGIKVTGKNILKNDYIGQTLSVGGVTATVNEDGSMTLNGTSTSAGILCWNLQSRASNSQSAQNNGKKNIPNGTYYLSGGIDSKLGIQLRASNTPSGGDTGYYSAGTNPVRIVIDDTYAYNWLRIMFNANKTFANETIYPMVRYENADSTYEPYKEIITDLPISTYFPNGLRSAGSVYDELTPNKATTRVGTVDLGTLTWTYNNTQGHLRFISSSISPLPKDASGSIANAICSKYEIVNEGQVYNNTKVGLCVISQGRAMVYDPNYTDVSSFTSAMSGVMLNFELSNETEQDINADLFYKFYGDGTEELLPSSLMNGSVDLGSLTWTYNTSGTPSFRADVTGLKYVTVATSVPNCLCSKYTTTSYDNAINNAVDKSISNRWNTTTIVIVDSDFTDATAFKNSLQGVMLWYEKSDSTPSTSAFFGDIEYYNTFEGEVPYRKFWMVNSKGERWNLTEREVRSFLNNPQGLGFSKTISTTRYGNAQVLTDITDNFPSPSGEVLFYDSHNSTRYEQYNEFVKFISYEPVTLYYKLPFSFYSQIPNVYTLECVVGTLTKTESKNDNLMTCPITFNALSYYRGEEVTINGTGTSYTITNDGDFPVGFEITLQGSLTNPYITLEQDGDLYGEAKFDDSTAFSSVYVNSNDGEQNVVLEQGGSILPNPLSYQDLSISNGSIYVTFVKLARGESTLTIGMDSGSLTSANIKFAPIYRSV